MSVIELDKSTIIKLLEMSEYDFRSVVNKDLRKNVSSEEYEALRSPEVVNRWYAALIGTSKSLDGQLSAGRQDYRVARACIDKALLLEKDEKKISELLRQRLELEESYGRSRANKLRFKSGLDQWIIEAQQIRSNVHGNLQSRIKELQTAILQHKNSWPPDVIPEQEDAELWATACDN